MNQRIKKNLEMVCPIKDKSMMMMITNISKIDFFEQVNFFDFWSNFWAKIGYFWAKIGYFFPTYYQFPSMKF